jgi:hypothetical protein
MIEAFAGTVSLPIFTWVPDHILNALRANSTEWRSESHEYVAGVANWTLIFQIFQNRLPDLELDRKLLNPPPLTCGHALRRVQACSVDRSNSFSCVSASLSLRESCMREIRTCSLGGGRRLARKRASSDPTWLVTEEDS